MPENISHYIITRYNLSLYSDRSMHDRIGCSPDEWMERRFPLFSKFTWPSMKAQTCRNFVWYIFMDRNTPADYRHQIEDLAFSNMRVEYLTQNQLSFLQQEIASARDIIITGRIDNDDAWHEDLVKVVQEHHARPTRLLQFPQCYWLELRTGRVFWQKWKWYHSLRPAVGNNPFMIEWRDQAKTIQIAPHTQLLKHVGIRRFRNDPRGTYRLIVCHGGNLANEIGDSCRYDPLDLSVLRQFNVKAGLEWMESTHSNPA